MVVSVMTIEPLPFKPIPLLRCDSRFYIYKNIIGDNCYVIGNTIVIIIILHKKYTGVDQLFYRFLWWLIKLCSFFDKTFVPLQVH